MHRNWWIVIMSMSSWAQFTSAPCAKLLSMLSQVESVRQKRRTVVIWMSLASLDQSITISVVPTWRWGLTRRYIVSVRLSTTLSLQRQGSTPSPNPGLPHLQAPPLHFPQCSVSYWHDAGGADSVVYHITEAIYNIVPQCPGNYSFCQPLTLCLSPSISSHTDSSMICMVLTWHRGLTQHDIVYHWGHPQHCHYHVQVTCPAHTDSSLCCN